MMTSPNCNGVVNCYDITPQAGLMCVASSAAATVTDGR